MALLYAQPSGSSAGWPFCARPTAGRDPLHLPIGSTARVWLRSGVCASQAIPAIEVNGRIRIGLSLYPGVGPNETSFSCLRWARPANNRPNCRKPLSPATAFSRSESLLSKAGELTDHMPLGHSMASEKKSRPLNPFKIALVSIKSLLFAICLQLLSDECM